MHVFSGNCSVFLSPQSLKFGFHSIQLDSKGALKGLPAGALLDTCQNMRGHLQGCQFGIASGQRMLGMRCSVGESGVDTTLTLLVNHCPTLRPLSLMAAAFGVPFSVGAESHCLLQGSFCAWASSG